MKTLVCLLEEPSAEAMLKGVLPRLIPKDIDVKYIVFEGKQDLEKQLERRLKFWCMANSVFLVMRDKDSGDCVRIKNNLAAKIKSSGKSDVSVVRIACHELESFYLGDLNAVEVGLEVAGLSRHQDSGKYRNPDTLANAAEELVKLTKNTYQKLAGSRAIAPHLTLGGANRSHSFNVLLRGVQFLSGKFA